MKPSYFFLLAVVGVLSSWFSVGYYHPDEHFQVLEFAGFLLGRIDSAELAWEYNAKIRPWLQPVLVALPMKLAFAVTSSPFVVSAFLKILSGSFLMSSLWCFMRSFERSGALKDLVLQTSDLKRSKALILVSPILGVCLARTSSESFAAGVLFLTLSYLIAIESKPSKPRRGEYFFLGVLCALMFFARFQMAFVCLAIAIWLLVVRRCKAADLVANACGFAIGSAVMIVLDSFLYGTFTVTPLNYFTENILNGVASKFGVAPWWGYLVPQSPSVISIVMVISMVLGFFALLQQPQSLMLYIYWMFVVGHSAVGHKEQRFLFPVLLFAPLFWISGWRMLSTLMRLVIPISWRLNAKAFLYIKTILILCLLHQSLLIRHPDFYGLAVLESISFAQSTASGKPLCVEWRLNKGYLKTAGNLTAGFFRSPHLQVVEPDRGQLCRTEDLYYRLDYEPLRSAVGRIEFVAEDRKVCRSRSVKARILAPLIKNLPVLDKLQFLDRDRDAVIYRCAQSDG